VIDGPIGEGGGGCTMNEALGKTCWQSQGLMSSIKTLKADLLLTLSDLLLDLCLGFGDHLLICW